MPIHLFGDIIEIISFFILTILNYDVMSVTVSILKFLIFFASIQEILNFFDCPVLFSYREFLIKSRVSSMSLLQN